MGALIPHPAWEGGWGLLGGVIMEICAGLGYADSPNTSNTHIFEPETYTHCLHS